MLTNHITGSSPLNYTDFTTIASLFSEYHVYVVSAGSQIKTGKELTDRLKSDPKSVTTGVAAIGAPGHISAGLLYRAIGGNAKDLKIVAFKGSAEALTSRARRAYRAHPGARQRRASARRRRARCAWWRWLPPSGSPARSPRFRRGGSRVWISCTAHGARSWRRKGLSAAQIAYWENALRKATETAEWKSDLEKTLGVDDFAIGAQFRKDLEKDYADTKAVLLDLGMAKQ